MEPGPCHKPYLRQKMEEYERLQKQRFQRQTQECGGERHPPPDTAPEGEPAPGGADNRLAAE